MKLVFDRQATHFAYYGCALHIRYTEVFHTSQAHVYRAGNKEHKE
jgi:hypothetical protein